MAITTNNISKSLEEGLNAIIGVDNLNYAPQWSQVFEVKDSKKQQETQLLRSGMGTAYQVAEGGYTPMDSVSDEWEQVYRHLSYKLGFEITREAIDDNKYRDLAADAAKELNRAFQQTKEIRAAAHFNNATSTARPYKGGDGVALLSTSHPLANGDTFSNFLSGMQLSESALEQADILIRKMVDERGLRIMVKPKQLIIPPDLAYVAARLLMSDLRPGTNANDVNALKRLGRMSKDPVELTYLTDADSWFIQTDINKGFQHFKRTAFEFKTKYDENTGSYYGFGYERYSFGHSNPRCVVGSLGS